MTDAKNGQTMSPTTRRTNSKPSESLDRSEREVNQIKETLVAGDRAQNNEDANDNKNIKKEGQVSSVYLGKLNVSSITLCNIFRRDLALAGEI